MSEGLKRHTRLEREAVVDALVPLIIRHMGHQLVALGVGGSFARGTDGPYSDIELIGFVKKPSGARAPVHFVHEGLAVGIRFPTRQEFLDSHKLKIGPAWPFRARTVLVPLINDAFIRELNGTPYNNAAEARLQALGEFWPKIQHATAKLLTAVEAGNTAPVPYLYWQAVEKFCIALSILNAQPFTSRAALFGEALGFSILPTGFEELLSPAGDAVDAVELARRAHRMVWEMQRLLTAHGAMLQAPALDAFVCEQSFGDLLLGSLHVERFAHRPVERPARAQARMGRRVTEP